MAVWALLFVHVVNTERARERQIQNEKEREAIGQKKILFVQLLGLSSEMHGNVMPSSGLYCFSCLFFLCAEEKV